MGQARLYRTAPRSLHFNSKPEYRSAMTYALDIVESITSAAHFPSVSITPNWSTGHVSIKIPIDMPLRHERLTQLQEALRLHDCEYLVRTHRPGGEYFQEPFIEIRSLNDDA
jgi:hypothetical protein